MDSPEVLVLDVNETLSDLSALDACFTEVGAPAHLRAAWFAGVLRDGFALTVLGGAPTFADLAADGLRTVLAPYELDRGADDAVAHVLAGLGSLPVHADVAAGLPRLAATDVRLVTLSNGSTSTTQGLLDGAGLSEVVDLVLSVDDAGAWKPEARSYAWAMRRAQVSPRAAMMVAVHPWDLAGAHAAGMRTAWVDRTGAPWPSAYVEPDVVVGGLDELADLVAAG